LIDAGGEKENLDAIPPVIMYEFPHNVLDVRNVAFGGRHWQS
jgi:hypothetical protein